MSESTVGAPTTDNTAEAPNDTGTSPSSSDLIGSDSQSPVSQDQQQSSNGHPAWQEVLQQLPEGYHGLVKPHLEKWEQNVSQQMRERAEEIRQLREQYSAFEPFVQRGVTPQQLQAAQVLAQQLAQNPQEFWHRLGEHYGFMSQQAQDDGLEFDDGDESEGTEDIPPHIAQQLQQMQMQQEQLQQYVEQQYQQEVQRQAESEIDNELGQLVQQYNLTPLEQQEVLQRALVMAQQNPDVTLLDAYKQWDAVKRQLFAQQNQNPAPNVLGTSGAHAVQPQKKFSEMTPEEQFADTVAALREATKRG